MQPKIAITYIGIMWYIDTSTDATGNISRGRLILRTSALFFNTDLVPEVRQSVMNDTMIMPAKMCSGRFRAPSAAAA